MNIKYSKPFAKNLSNFYAKGDDPQGICMDGSALTFETCRDGNSPTGGNCSPVGALPTLGYCDFGNNAVEGCTSGGIHF